MTEIAKNYHNYLKRKKELINELNILSDTDGLNFKNEKINGLFNDYSSNFNSNSSFSSIELNIESIDKISSDSDDDDNDKKDEDNNSKYRKSIKNINVKNATSNNKSNTQFNKNKINTSKNVDFQQLLLCNFNNYEERYKLIIDRRTKIFNNLLEINVNDCDYLKESNKIKLLIRRKTNYLKILEFRLNLLKLNK